MHAVFQTCDIKHITALVKTHPTRPNKLVFMSCGSKENPRVMEAAENLRGIGMNAVGYISEGTAHEWHTWRRSLYEFAQLLFK